MGESFQLFNLQTMSGVFPGTRTLIYQRVRIRPLNEPASAAGNQPPVTQSWARLLWYSDPPACVVELNNGPLLRIPDPEGSDLGPRLQAGLAATGWELLTCGACAFWQPLTATADGLALGRCTWHDRTADASIYEPTADRDVYSLDALAMQSLLALDCPHWQKGQTPVHAPVQAPERTSAPAEQPHAAPAIARRAERENDERWSWWGRLRRSWRSRQGEAESPAPARWEDKIVERSGVGAGTEPCFACQGRIANLGALAVASDENDKQTFSVWRCRVCCTYYLNDWIDRWERTDSLETEETYYRLAPHEALAILAVIDGVVHADHPARRHERNAQRLWMQQFLAGRTILSHQIKQGR